MKELTESALSLLNDGWSIERVREHLRGNYINATMSAVEEAIRAAQQSVKRTGEDVPLYKNLAEMLRSGGSELLRFLTRR